MVKMGASRIAILDGGMVSPLPHRQMRATLGRTAEPALYQLVSCARTMDGLYMHAETHRAQRSNSSDTTSRDPCGARKRSSTGQR